MSGGLFSRLKTWIQDEKLLYTDQNAEFNNIIANVDAPHLGGVSDTLNQFKAVEDPGAPGVENYGPTVSIADEIERLRFVVARMLDGGTVWNANPVASLSLLSTQVGTLTGALRNKIISGRVDSNKQPMFLQASNTALKCSVLGATTNLILNIVGASSSVTTDILSSAASAPEGSNNTGTFMQFVVEKDGSLTMRFLGTPGSNITAKEGRLIAFKVGTEPMTGIMEKETIYAIGTSSVLYKVTNVTRGSLFDSTDAAVAINPSPSGTVTLLRIAQVFITQGNVVYLVETPVFVSGVQPASPSAGDHWFNTSTQTWLRYNGSIFDTTLPDIHLGYMVCDATKCVGTRSNDFSYDYSSENKLTPYVLFDGSAIVTQNVHSSLNVYGTKIAVLGSLVWDMTTSIDTGTLAGASTYYLYVTVDGTPIFSLVAPVNRIASIKGFYHPSKPWRAIGSFYVTSVGPNVIVPDYIVPYGESTGVSLLDASISVKKLQTSTFRVTTLPSPFTTTNTAYQNVVDFAIPQPTGRPILITLVSTGGVANVNLVSGSPSTGFLAISDLSDNIIQEISFGTAVITTVTFSPGAFSFWTTANVGTSQLRLKFKVSSGTTGTITNCTVLVRELL